MSRGEELLNVPATVHVSARITRCVVDFRMEFQMYMCVVPEFVAVIGRVAVKVTPSAMTVFA